MSHRGGHPLQKKVTPLPLLPLPQKSNAATVNRYFSNEVTSNELPVPLHFFVTFEIHDLCVNFHLLYVHINLYILLYI